MSLSLIPEKSIAVSPSLATTIGLEEATMLAVLADLFDHRGGRSEDGYHWLRLGEDCVQRFMPFWSDHDIQRISKNLVDTGVLLLSSAPYSRSRELHFAFNERSGETKAPQNHVQSQEQRSRAPSFAASPQRSNANRIAPNWQPNSDLIKQLGQHNIPTEFVYEQLPEFITYWSERDEPHHSWGSKFLKQVKRKWVERQSEFGRRDQEVAMFSGWQPSQDALHIMIRQAEINPTFIDDAVPEFVLYWQERGEKSRAWNSKFIQHVRRQWARYNSSLEHDTEPRRIPDNWQPNSDVYDVLKLANIDLKFAQALVPEFVLFWNDSKQVHSSWNTKFLQHSKYHWARRHELPMNSSNSLQARHNAGQQNTHQSGRTRDRSIVDDLTDRSWAG
jgi:hypothetical protein